MRRGAALIGAGVVVLSMASLARAQKPGTAAVPHPTPAPTVARATPAPHPSGTTAPWFFGTMRARVAILGPPRPDRCTGDLTKPVYELCDDPAYREAVTPYLAHHMQPPIFLPDQGRKWRRTMARWLPCMFEALEDASPCRRLAAVKLLNAIGNPAAVDPLL